MHISLDDDLIAELDRRVGPRGRSPFIAAAIRQALADEHRWELIESSLGSITDEGHDWDADPAAWVHRERRADAARMG